MVELVTVAGLLALVASLVWWLVSRARSEGRDQERLESLKEANRRINEAASADAAVRADMASGGLYDDDGYRRD